MYLNNIVLVFKQGFCRFYEGKCKTFQDQVKKI